MQLKFVSADSPEVPAKYLAEIIAAQLDQKRSVLWLLSGGSAVKVAVGAAGLLAGKDLTGLTVSLIDERYGPVGHADSNWQQLEDAGFNPPGATLHPVLTGASQEETAAAFDDFLQAQFAQADFKLGLLGIGPDGHTSGILPHSPAITASGLAFSYDGGVYERVTTTAGALMHLDEAVLYVAGQNKWTLLDRLETDLPVAEQPAQLLKTVAKVTIFTDRPLS